MKQLLLFIISISALGLHAQDQKMVRVPEQTEYYKDIPVVTPGDGTNAPSDAIVLFDGTNLDAFQKSQFGSPARIEELVPIAPKMDPNYTGAPAAWNIVDGALEVAPGQGDIATKRSFGDIQLHVEWKAPKMPAERKGQGGGNSGIFLMGLYEVQVLNSYENPTYSNGQAASLYKQFPPLVNASRPPETWQTYDIVFMAPRFSEKGTVVRPATVTIIHNGVLVQNNVTLLGPTCYIGLSYYVSHPQKLPLKLQDHGDRIQFRNIWVREL